MLFWRAFFSFSFHLGTQNIEHPAPSPPHIPSLHRLWCDERRPGEDLVAGRVRVSHNPLKRRVTVSLKMEINVNIHFDSFLRSLSSSSGVPRTSIAANQTCANCRRSSFVVDLGPTHLCYFQNLLPPPHFYSLPPLLHSPFIYYRLLPPPSPV